MLAFAKLICNRCPEKNSKLSAEGLDLKTLKTSVSVFITSSEQKRSSYRNEEEAYLGLVRSFSVEGKNRKQQQGGCML